MPTFTHALDVQAPPSEVFAILDDVSRTPQWLKRCTGIDKLDDGPNTEGTRLRYHYKDGNRTGTMDGTITAHQPDRHIAMDYTDKMMDVTVDFVTGPGADEATTRLTHSIDIRTKGIGKVFAPLIRRSLPKQTTDAMERLKALAESART